LESRKTVALELGKATVRYALDQEDVPRSPNTVRTSRQKGGQLVKSFGEDRQLAELELEDLKTFLRDLREKDRSPVYVRNWAVWIQGFFHWARKNRYAIHESLVDFDADRWFTLAIPDEVEPDFEVYDADEMERILEAAGKTRDAFTSARNRLLVRFYTSTGVRLTEALEVRLEDVQDDRVRIRWVDSVLAGAGGSAKRERRGAKLSKNRWVPITSRMQRDIERFVERVRPDDCATDHLFVTRTGTPMTVSGVQKLFARIQEETGVRAHAHGLRHTFATEYLRRGGEIDRLRRILGHTTFKQTARYVQYAAVDIGRGIDDLVAVR